MDGASHLANVSSGRHTHCCWGFNFEQVWSVDLKPQALWTLPVHNDARFGETCHFNLTFGV